MDLICKLFLRGRGSRGRSNWICHRRSRLSFFLFPRRSAPRISIPTNLPFARRQDFELNRFFF